MGVHHTIYREGVASWQAAQSVMLNVKNSFVERVYREHEQALVHFLVSILKDREEAKEVSQEVFLRILQGPDPEDIRNPKAFIYRTASNLALNRIRYKKIRRVEQGEPQQSEPVSRTLDQERKVAVRQEMEQLLAVMETMPPRCREVFVLCRFYELDYRQAAKRLGISKSMVKKHMKRAVLHCVSNLGG